MDSRGGTKIVVVPGLAVRRYAEPPVARVREAGYDVELRPAPGWHGVPDDIGRYGLDLAEELERRGEPVAVLVGLSVGTQAAAVAAAATSLVQHLVLVSPTIDPSQRSMPKSIAAWIKGDSRDDSAMMPDQLLDWARAGPRRILSGFRSAIDLRLEDILPGGSAELTMIHGEYDPLTSYAYAARLAADHGGRLLVAPAGSHSWPIDDPDGFSQLITELVP